MPRWRKGRGGFDAPVDHLSADRLADIVNAERSSPPDLPTLNLPPPPPVMVPAPEDSSHADETLVNGWDEAALPPEPPPPEPPPPEPPRAEAPPPEPIAATTSPATLPPEWSPDAPPPVGKTSAPSKNGRHRRPTSLRSVALGFRRGIFTAHALALMGIISVLVVATAVLGVY